MEHLFFKSSSEATSTNCPTNPQHHTCLATDSVRLSVLSNSVPSGWSRLILYIVQPQSVTTTMKSAIATTANNAYLNTSNLTIFSLIFLPYSWQLLWLAFGDDPECLSSEIFSDTTFLDLPFLRGIAILAPLLLFLRPKCHRQFDLPAEQ